MIRQLAHLNFSTDKPAEMVDFYTRGLGLGIAFTLDDDAGTPFGWYVDCGNRTFIEIFDRVRSAKQWGWKPEELRDGTRYRHLSLEVTGMAAFCAALKSRGIRVGEPKLGMDASWQAWLSDPDGNTIELMEYTTDSLQTGGRGMKAVAT